MDEEKSPWLQWSDTACGKQPSWEQKSVQICCLTHIYHEACQDRCLSSMSIYLSIFQYCTKPHRLSYTCIVLSVPCNRQKYPKQIKKTRHICRHKLTSTGALGMRRAIPYKCRTKLMTKWCNFYKSQVTLGLDKISSLQQADLHCAQGLYQQKADTETRQSKFQYHTDTKCITSLETVKGYRNMPMRG